MSNVPKKYDGMMIVDVDDAGRFGDYGYITDNYVARTSTQINPPYPTTASLALPILIYALVVPKIKPKQQKTMF